MYMHPMCVHGILGGGVAHLECFHLHSRTDHQDRQSSASLSENLWYVAAHGPCQGVALPDPELIGMRMRSELD